MLMSFWITMRTRARYYPRSTVVPVVVPVFGHLFQLDFRPTSYMNWKLVRLPLKSLNLDASVVQRAALKSFWEGSHGSRLCKRNGSEKFYAMEAISALPKSNTFLTKGTSAIPAGKQRLNPSTSTTGNTSFTIATCQLDKMTTASP